MDIKNIRTFVRVAELKSITKAADELNYVQSTVTMQMQQLERELGYPLFDRIGKRISLTSLGEQFLGCSYEMLKTVQKAENLNNNDEEINGVLRVGVVESLLISTFIDLLPRFKEKYKNVDLRIKSGHTVDLIEGLKQNDLDLIYVSKAPNFDNDLECYCPKKQELIFVAGKNHPLARQNNISPKELMNHRFVITEREGICYGILQNLAAKHETTLDAVIEVDNVVVITQLVKNGIGLAFLPQYLLKNEIEKGDVVRLDVTLPPQIYYSQVLVHKSRWIAPYVQGMIDMIGDNL